MNEETDIVQADESFEDSSYTPEIGEETPAEDSEALHEDWEVQEGLTEDGESDEAAEESSAEGSFEEPMGEAEELSEIRNEIMRLKEELRQLDELKAQSQRMLKEFDEFLELFPEERIESIPDEVWDQAKRGTSLAAAYALYEKKREASQRLAAKINAKNAALSAGKAGSDSAGEYFSYDQVREMSQAEVRKNYTKIRESMKKWS